MRKKSHISLAKYLVNNMQVQELNEHRKAFYIGSILPDLKPSFFTKKHTIDETFGTLMEEIRKVTIDYDVDKGITCYYARHLGIITHYLADYCTFPHNSVFHGTIKEHCAYEKELKSTLKEYVQQDEAQRNRECDPMLPSMEDVLRLISRTHEEYLRALKVVKEDILYIVDLCYRVVDAILRFIELGFSEINRKSINFVNSIAES